MQVDESTCMCGLCGNQVLLFAINREATVNQTLCKVIKNANRNKMRTINIATTMLRKQRDIRRHSFQYLLLPSTSAVSNPG